MKTSSDDSGQFVYPRPIMTEPTSVRFPLGPGARAMSQLAWRPEATMLKARVRAADVAATRLVASWSEHLFLSPRQLARAISYYLSNAARYPGGLVAAMQSKLGVAASGTMDELTIAAIARYQRSKGLRACDGKADEHTLVAMFGADVRMRADARPEPEMSHEGTDGIIRASVKLTAKIKRAWQMLRPYLPRDAVLVAGLRSWADSARMLENYFADNAVEIVAKGMLSEAEVADILAERDYQQMYDWVWSTKGGLTQYKVAMPGQSRHCRGDSFDVAGSRLRSLVTAVADARLANPQFNALFAGYSPEPERKCVHIDLR